VPTPVDPARLKHHLDTIGYDKAKTDYLVNGFTHGFRLQHSGDVTNTLPNNDPSIDMHFEAAKKKIDKEVQAGRMKGPFLEPPFTNFHVSPLKLREKTTVGTYRLIHNLSWPYDETAINESIPDAAKSVKYSNVQHAIKLIMKHPKGSFTRKTDVKDAFKIIPVHPDDYHKLGLFFGGQYYYDVTLPAGGSSSCQIFEEFSTALEAINTFYTSQDSTHYLDDFFFIDESVQQSLNNKLTFDAICYDIGVPQAPEKVTAPSHITEFLGICLDSLNWIATLPLAKLRSYVADVEAALGMKKLTQLQLQQVVGKLSFAALVVPARAFLRRLIAMINTVRKPYHFIRNTNSMKQDLRVWLHFLQKYNGVTYFRALSIIPDDHYNMGADACKFGYGATFKDYWIQERYPQHWTDLYESNDMGISTLELFPIYVLIAMFGHKIPNSCVLFHSDNQGVVDVINKQSSTNLIIMNIVRPLVLLLMKYNIMLRSQHIPGVKNTLCDRISRFQVDSSLLADYGMRPTKQHIPSRLQSRNFKLK
jgi:hypothetical protein